MRSLPPLTIRPGARTSRREEEYAEHATPSGTCPTGPTAKTAAGQLAPTPDGQHEFGYLAKPEPLGDEASVPAPDPKLYATCNGAMGKPKGPALGTEAGPVGKIKDALS
jgi:Mn-containing catalase